MSLKETIIAYLREKAHPKLLISEMNINSKLKPKMDRLVNLINDPTKHEQKGSNQWKLKMCEDLKQQALKRYFNLSDIISEVIELEFTTDIPDNIRPFLSEYGTFCDRYKFYYDRDLEFSFYDELKLTQIVMCEYFNSYQNYFLHYTLSEKMIKAYQGNTISMMHYIGLIEEDIKYSQKNRQFYSELYKNIVTSFPINAATINYMINKFIFNDPDTKFGYKKLEISTVDILEYCYFLKHWKLYNDGLYMREIDSIVLNINYYRKNILFFKKLSDGTYQRVRSTTKEVKEHSNAIKIINKLNEYNINKTK